MVAGDVRRKGLRGVTSFVAEVLRFCRIVVTVAIRF